jgi:hypothetical protein
VLTSPWGAQSACPPIFFEQKVGAPQAGLCLPLPVKLVNRIN